MERAVIRQLCSRRGSARRRSCRRTGARSTSGRVSICLAGAKCHATQVPIRPEGKSDPGRCPNDSGGGSTPTASSSSSSIAGRMTNLFRTAAGPSRSAVAGHRPALGSPRIGTPPPSWSARTRRGGGSGSRGRADRRALIVDEAGNISGRAAARPARAHRGLRPDRRLRDGRPGIARWVHRLAVPAPLRLAGVFRGAARRCRTRALADRHDRSVRPAEPPVPPRHAGPGDGAAHRIGPGADDRLHAGAQGLGRGGPHRGGAGGPRRA
jgi:hypothetical protein